MNVIKPIKAKNESSGYKCQIGPSQLIPLMEDFFSILLVETIDKNLETQN